MITIELLGRTTVIGEHRSLSTRELGGVKPRQLLEMLALEPGRAVSKEVLADRLWEGRPPTGYLGTVESYMCVIRRHLRPLTSDKVPVTTSHGGYVLDPDRVHVDAVAVRGLLSGDEHDVCRALDLMTGVLLADEPYATWAAEAREAFDQSVGEACTRAARQANEHAHHTTAARLAGEALARCPYSEAALRELMTALSSSGARAEAVRAYEQMRERIAHDLGLGPSPATRTLFLTILRGDSTTAQEADRAELATMLQRIHHALTADPTALAGVPWSRELGQLLRTLPA